VVATLHRDNAGLGFSVAGGKGTMPYRVDDEVSPTCMIVVISCLSCLKGVIWRKKNYPFLCQFCWWTFLINRQSP